MDVLQPLTHAPFKKHGRGGWQDSHSDIPPFNELRLSAG
jgi:hypothetical protein